VFQPVFNVVGSGAQTVYITLGLMWVDDICNQVQNWFAYRPEVHVC